MGRELRSWARTAAFPAAVPVAVLVLHETPGCGLGAHAVDSALLSSQVLVLLGMVLGGAVAMRPNRGSKGGFVAAENQASPTMDDWDPPDRPTPGGEEYEAEDDDPNVAGQLAVLVFGLAAVLFASVLAVQQYVPGECVRGIFWVLF